MFRPTLLALLLVAAAGVSCQHHAQDRAGHDSPDRNAPAAINPSQLAAQKAAIRQLVCERLGPRDAFRCPPSASALEPTALTHLLIREVAADAGDRPDWQQKSLAARTVVVAPAELPDAIKDAANRELAERAALNDAGSTGAGGADFRPASAFVAITRGDTVIGYVVSIDDTIDHPGWRGSGVHLFYDLDARVVADTEWSG